MGGGEGKAARAVERCKPHTELLCAALALSAKGSAGEPPVRPLLDDTTYLCTAKFATVGRGCSFPSPA